MRCLTTKTSPGSEGCSGSIHVAGLRIVAQRDQTIDRHPADKIFLIASMSVSSSNRTSGEPKIEHHCGQQTAARLPDWLFKFMRFEFYF
jgi:hypothetical protein